MHKNIFFSPIILHPILFLLLIPIYKIYINNNLVHKTEQLATFLLIDFFFSFLTRTLRNENKMASSWKKLKWLNFNHKYKMVDRFDPCCDLHYNTDNFRDFCECWRLLTNLITFDEHGRLLINLDNFWWFHHCCNSSNCLWSLERTLHIIYNHFCWTWTTSDPHGRLLINFCILMTIDERDRPMMNDLNHNRWTWSTYDKHG